MNIVLLNQNWLRAELQERGHTVISAGWMSHLYDITIPWGSTAEDCIKSVRNYFEPDIFVYYDNSSLPTILDIENLQYPKVFISVDTFHHLSWHSDFSNFFNITLVAQKEYVQKLCEARSDFENVYWFPLWVNQSWEPDPVKTFEVSFRGTLDKNLHPERYAFFSRVAEEVPLDFGQGKIDDVYPKSKIVLNQAVRNDVNFRNFEAMMGGALLLTPKVGNGLEDLFENGRHCVFYEEGNAEDAIAKIKYYLSHDKEREEIASAGRALVLERHSSKLVAILLEQYLENALRTGIKNNKQSSIAIQTFIARALWHMLRKENDEKYITPIEKTLNCLQKEIQSQKGVTNQAQSIETTIVIADLICADILDGDSYTYWKNDLIDSFPNLPFTGLLRVAYSDEPANQEARDQLAQVRYSLVQRILNVE